MIKFLPCGDTALTIEFGREIDEVVSQRVLQLDKDIVIETIQGLNELVPTYRSLLVHFNPLNFDLEKFKQLVLKLVAKPLIPPQTIRRRLVPVYYDGEDLVMLANLKNIPVEEIINLHLNAVYRVYMIGFLPGYAMMGGLNPVLATPRRLSPRPSVPAGNIAIGGQQALVGSVEAPSGWHMLGRTPMKNFDKTRDPAFILGAGDEVVFKRIPHFDTSEGGAWL
jgi:KipI family sensor histidine kinase inhibitor